ncbi:type II CRISPR RNA-guided endonuclease Cas9 [Amedibacillus dolichus]|uniref:CRISPR-associated endonuclease Cas9 n=3 Tax=Amedibacillus dolichus TaxID=31971 RepID=A0A415PKT9_9FIRM|nr:type II CRISPR RNA-guided endonuclease Cas9 [Amedibacillus dolichus]
MMEVFMGRLVLGLDIGITSVGFGIIDLDESEIVDYGVRLFKEGTAAENETRRTKRGGRRLKRRRVTRREDMLHLLKQAGIISTSFHPLNNPYDVRVKGLNERLNGEELATALLHLCKHRGSSVETIEDDEAKAKEAGETKKVLSMNDQLLKSGKYVCEIQKERLRTNGHIRGHENNFKTRAYVDEAFQILSHQDLSNELKSAIITIISRKRMYYDGPGGPLSPTPYGRYTYFGQKEPIDLIEKMRGKCSLFPNEPRAPKLAYSAELFNLLNDLNNLSIEGEKLTSEQKAMILKIVHEKGKITPKQLAKEVGVSLEQIRGFRIDTKGSPLLSELTGYKMIREVLEKSNDEHLEDHVFYDEIAEILTKTKDIEGRKKQISELSSGLNEESVHQLAGLTKFTAYHSLSFKALRLINEEMLKTELNQMQIITLSGLKQNNELSVKGMKNIQADDTAILSPVAKRAQRETFKVVNRLREIYGEFDNIVVEMAREKNSEEQRKAIRERQKFFEMRNKQVADIIGDDRKINAKLREKLVLYQEQDGKTAYSLEPIDLKLLIDDPNAYEVDHIIPISISLDDSITNKVLVTHRENQEKGNLTPISAFVKGRFTKGSLAQYKAYCLKLKEKNIKTNKGYRKKVEQYLLNENDIYKYDIQKEFINRNLVDTSYASRVVLNTLTTYFKQNEIPTKVFTVKGSLTNAFRRKINLKKDRDEDYGHHAIDALIIASMPKMRLLSTIFSRYKIEDIYDESTGEVFSSGDDSMYYDDRYFAFIASLKAIKVRKFSHKIDTKPNRSVADETIYSTRVIDGKEKVVKKYKDIYDPKFTALAEDILNNAYQEKYLMALHDPQTFDQIVKVVNYYFEEMSKSEKYFTKDKKGRIKISGTNPLSLYRDEHGMLKKYSKKGDGPAITQMKYFDGVLGNHIDISAHYQVRDKKVVLQQISPYRTDFYYSKENGYKFVTIRYKDVRWSEKKKKYVIDQQDYAMKKAEKKIDDTYEFQFSMHRDELIGITKAEGESLIYPDEAWYNFNFFCHDGETPEILKFTATNNDKRNAIEVKPIYCYCKKRLMPTISKKIVCIDKYATDVVGNLYKVKKNTLKFEFD